MKQRLCAYSLLICALFVVRTARADAIAFSYSGPGVSMAGSLFGGSNGDGSWSISGIAASYNQIEVTEIVPLNADPHFLYNNRYYDANNGNYAVDYLGIVFNVPGLGDVNFCSYTAAGGCGSGGYASILWDGSGYQYTQVSPSNDASPVPEPTTLVLLGGGLAAVGVALRRRLCG